MDEDSKDFNQWLMIAKVRGSILDTSNKNNLAQFNTQLKSNYLESPIGRYFILSPLLNLPNIYITLINGLKYSSCQ